MKIYTLISFNRKSRKITEKQYNGIGNNSSINQIYTTFDNNIPYIWVLSKDVLKGRKKLISTLLKEKSEEVKRLGKELIALKHYQFETLITIHRSQLKELQEIEKKKNQL